MHPRHPAGGSHALPVSNKRHVIHSRNHGRTPTCSTSSSSRFKRGILVSVPAALVLAVIVVNIWLLLHLKGLDPTELPQPHSAYDGLFFNYIPVFGDEGVTAPPDSIAAVRQVMAMVPLQVAANMVETNMRSLDWVTLQGLAAVRHWLDRAQAPLNPITIAAESLPAAVAAAADAAAGKAAAAATAVPAAGPASPPEDQAATGSDGSSGDAAGAQHGWLQWLWGSTGSSIGGSVGSSGSSEGVLLAPAAVTGSWLLAAGWQMPGADRTNSTQQQQQQQQGDTVEGSGAAAAAPLLLLLPRPGKALSARHRQLQLAAAGVWGAHLDTYQAVDSQAEQTGTPQDDQQPRVHVYGQVQQGHEHAVHGGSSGGGSNAAALPRGVLALMAGLVDPGGVVVDVGVGLGESALLLAGKVGAAGRVIVYEPQRLLLQLLAANSLVNGATTIELHHSCPGHTSGYADVRLAVRNGGLLDNSSSSGGSSGGSDDSGTSSSSGGGSSHGGYCSAAHHAAVCVRVVRLDEDLHDLSHLSLLKITLSGAERLVVYGAQGIIKRLKPILVMRPSAWHSSRLIATTSSSSSSEPGCADNASAGHTAAGCHERPPAQPQDEAWHIQQHSSTAEQQTSSGDVFRHILLQQDLPHPFLSSSSRQPIQPPVQDETPAVPVAGHAQVELPALAGGTHTQDELPVVPAGGHAQWFVDAEDTFGAHPNMTDMLKAFLGQLRQQQWQQRQQQQDIPTTEPTTVLLSRDMGNKRLEQVQQRRRQQQQQQQQPWPLQSSSPAGRGSRGILSASPSRRTPPAAATAGTSSSNDSNTSSRPTGLLKHSGLRAQSALTSSSSSSSSGRDGDGATVLPQQLSPSAQVTRQLLDSRVIEVTSSGSSGTDTDLPGLTGSTGAKSAHEMVQELLAQRTIISGERPDYVIKGGNAKADVPEDLLGAGMVNRPGSDDVESEGFDLADIASRVYLPPDVQGFDVDGFLKGLGYRVLQHRWRDQVVVWLPSGFSSTRAQKALRAAVVLSDESSWASWLSRWLGTGHP